MKTETTILFRPVNDKELEKIKASCWKRFPPRLPEQPIFYPVMNETYATQIAKEWNVPAYGAGYVLKFEIEKNTWINLKFRTLVELFIMSCGYQPKN